MNASAANAGVDALTEASDGLNPMASSRATVGFSSALDAAPSPRGAAYSGDSGETLLHELFEAQAAETPNATAIVCEEICWSYAALDSATNRLARRLQALGARAGRFVAIYFERSELPIIAILACLKSGATYVPIDPSYPKERIRHITGELGVMLCLTDSDLAPQVGNLFGDVPSLVLDRQWATSGQGADDTSISRSESGLTPGDLAYIIYTSGTTGRPKGVMAEHCHVTRFVGAFNEVCATGVNDRVYQGFALSFDGSVEEMWMAFSNGSTLVVPTRDVTRFGPDLGQYLAKHEVSYLSTVPTLLATIPEDIASLRTIVVSGEACPPDLVDRWVRSGRRLLNVYGPTEATVNTTVAECRSGRPVTIGRPLRGYQLHIVDEALRPVPPGDEGELLIGGQTLARGYVNQPELTEQRFVEAPHIDETARMYRTGDLVRLNAAGELEFRGRIDTQVKIRGYRVELSEIEHVLGEDSRISAAVVRVVDRGGMQQLAANVIVEWEHLELDREQVLTLLERRLPPYMIPSFLDVVSEFPRTASGKVDRRQLPAPVQPLVRTSGSIAAPESALEHQIARVWQDVLGVESVSVTDDFFVDLGGYSLLAARMATALREVTGRPVAIRDAYQCPTIRALAERIEAMPRDDHVTDDGDTTTATTRGSRAVFHSIPRSQRLLTFALQAVSMYIMASMALVPIGSLVLLGYMAYDEAISVQRMLVFGVAVILLTWPVFLLLSIAAKWIIIGRYKPGDYPLWSLYYWRWWLCNRIQAFSGLGGLSGTPIQPLVFRLMGAKVGARCTLDTGLCSAWDLVSIGDDTSIGADTQLLGYRVEDGMLRLGTVRIGSRCFIGIHSALGLNVSMGDDSCLDDQSLLPDGDSVPSGEGRRGSPSQPAEIQLPSTASRYAHWRHHRASGRHRGNPRWPVRRFCFGLVHLLALELTGLLLAIPALLWLAAMVLLFVVAGLPALVAAILFSVPFGVVTSCLTLAVVRRLVLSGMDPGLYPVESMTYVRKWLSDGLMTLSRGLLMPVYTTLYLPPWLRLMGAKIGPRAELSTVWNFAPELIDVGAESFFADGSIIGGRRSHLGMCQVAVNRIGERSFVGNSAVLPVGASMGDRCLLGVQSIPPPEQTRTPDSTEWLGSPSFALPHRPKVGNFHDSVIYHPTRKLYAQRALIDGLRILIPGYISLAAFAAWAFIIVQVFLLLGVGYMLALAPVVTFVTGLGTVVIVAMLKKVVMGTFRPEVKPLWSFYVWLNEMVNGAYESIVSRVLAPLLGTPFIRPFLRLMGCRIGRHTYIATTLFSEWDLVEIRDYAALNHGVVVQNHLFEDRIFKSSHLVVGSEASIGNMSVLLYDSEVKECANVGPLSLVMKGETLAERTRWHGIPTSIAVVPLPGSVSARGSHAQSHS